jgi:CBS domain-containing protein
MADASNAFPSEPLEALGVLTQQARSLYRNILQARDMSSLRSAASEVPTLVARLHGAGCMPAPIADGVKALNTALFERAWQLVASPALVANSCLFVMGSEGRGEQILRTDQDNGLVLRDGGTDDAEAKRACEGFSDALRTFGYPDCPGGIMVNRPAWCQRASDFRRTVRRWLLMPDAEGLLSLAIFLDARPVCGDSTLLESMRDEVFELASGNDAMLSQFAAAIETFADGSGWWDRWRLTSDADKHGVDIKKQGLFPLVHGARSMALGLRVRALGTVERIAALQAAGVLPASMARDLVESLHCLMELKLKTGLAAPDAGEPNLVRVERMSTLDRSALDAALGVVRRFKTLLRRRFHLDVLS